MPQTGARALLQKSAGRCDLLWDFNQATDRVKSHVEEVDVRCNKHIILCINSMQFPGSTEYIKHISLGVVTL